jgi:Cas7 group CRISPR-associated protein Csh2
MTPTAIPRVTGLLVIEARNSNPNGDPDRESDPRTRANDGHGVISDVSYKRKNREIVQNKDGPVWQSLQNLMGLDRNRFRIHVDSMERQAERAARVDGMAQSLADAFWDVRVFGSTSLEENNSFIRTGVAQFALGVSIAKIRIRRDTNTVKANVDANSEKDRGMAPLGFRVVEHAVYAMPFLINPSAAHRSACLRDDIELLMRLIPYAYPHTASRVRPLVEVRHAWYFEHNDALGSASDFAVLDALTPKKANPNEPSLSWNEYSNIGEAVPSVIATRFNGRYRHFGDMCDPNFVNQVFPR